MAKYTLLLLALILGLKSGISALETDVAIALKDWHLSSSLDIFRQIYVDLYTQATREGRTEHVDISPFVAAFMTQWTEDIIRYNKSELIFPVLRVKFTDTSYNMVVNITRGRATGGETMELDGPALLYVDAAQNVIIDVPFQLRWVALDFLADYTVMGISSKCKLFGDTTAPPKFFFSLRITPWGIVSVRDILIKDPSVAVLSLEGAGSVINLGLAMVWVLCAFTLLALVESGYLIYLFVKHRKSKRANAELKGS